MFNLININIMKRVNLKISVIALAIGLVMVSCGGGGNKQQQSATTETEIRNTNEIYTIPIDKIDVNEYAVTLGGSKEAVIAEIPKELFKIIGELRYCQINTSGVLAGYKYTLMIVTKKNEDAVADLEKLAEYYKSIGATVEKESKSSYDVVFDYAKSVSIVKFGNTIQVQFSVVKK